MLLPEFRYTSMYIGTDMVADLCGYGSMETVPSYAQDAAQQIEVEMVPFNDVTCFLCDCKAAKAPPYS